MKILELQAYQFDGNNFLEHQYQYKVLETPDYIYINGQAHTKDTLSPVFGKNLSWYTEYEHILTDNYIGGPNSALRNGHATIGAGIWQYGPMSPTVSKGNNGQFALLNEKKLTRMWQSSYEPDFIYCCLLGASDSQWLYKVDRQTMEIVRRKYLSGQFWDGQPIFFHEDENFLYAMVTPNDTVTSGERLFKVNKATFEFYWLGYTGASNRTEQLISASDKYFTTMTNWRTSASGTQFVVLKSAYDDDTYSGGNEDFKSANLSNFRYRRLPMYRKDVFSGEYEIVDAYLGVSGDNTKFSDNETFNNKSGDYLCHGSALVHDYTSFSQNSLRRTFKIARWYTTYIDDQDNFQFIRFNVSIDDDDVNPAFDARKCILSNPHNLELPRATQDSWAEGMPVLYLGSSTRAILSNMVAYFSSDDENHHYLIMSSEMQTQFAENDPSYNSCQKMYVFKIKNHASSIVDDVHEDFSRELELIQVIKESGGTFGLLRPNNDPKTFIYCKMLRNDHSVYNWNQGKEEFEKVDTLSGRLLGAGCDSEGRVYFVNMPKTYQCEVDMHTIKLPSTITLDSEFESYEYTGSTIDSYIEVSAFNYLGTQIITEVDLQIVGAGVEFEDSTQRKTIQTLSDNPKQVNIKIKSGAVVQINASIGFADSGNNLSSFSLDNKDSEKDVYIKYNL